MPDSDPLERRRARDRERARRRAGERAAAGLCVSCGRRPPEAGRTACAECAERKRAASRARDARLRAEGRPRRRREPREDRPATPPPADGRADRPRRLHHEMRRQSAGGRPPPVRTLPGQGPRGRPAPPREGQGTGSDLRRPRSRPEEGGRPRREPQAPRGPDRRGQLHAVRPPAAGRGRHRLRDLPRGAPGRREGDLRGPDDPPGYAADAEARPPTGEPAAPHARSWRPGAETGTGGIARPGSATAGGARPGAASTATCPARGPRGVRLARSAPTSGPAISGGCRSTRRATR